MLVSVKLNLPKEVYEAYESLGPIDYVFSTRLIASVNHNSAKPLYVSDDLRRRFDKLFGRNFSTAEELLAAVEKLMTVKVSDITIPLQPTLLTRLKTRCFGKPFEDFLTEQTVKGLEEFAGMR